MGWFARIFPSRKHCFFFGKRFPVQKIPRQVGSRQPALCCSYFPEAACKRPEEALQAGIQEKLWRSAATGCTPSLPILTGRWASKIS